MSILDWRWRSAIGDSRIETLLETLARSTKALRDADGEFRHRRLNTPAEHRTPGTRR